MFPIRPFRFTLIEAPLKSSELYHRRALALAALSPRKSSRGEGFLPARMEGHRPSLKSDELENRARRVRRISPATAKAGTRCRTGGSRDIVRSASARDGGGRRIAGARFHRRRRLRSLVARIRWRRGRTRTDRWARGGTRLR